MSKKAPAVKPVPAPSAPDIRTAFAGWWAEMVINLNSISIALEKGPLYLAVGSQEAGEYRNDIDMALDCLKSEGPAPDAVSTEKLLAMIEAARREVPTL